MQVHYSQAHRRVEHRKKARQGQCQGHHTYGTKRINGYKIIEETLNLQDVRIFDYVETPWQPRSVLNKKGNGHRPGQAGTHQTGVLQDWIWKDPDRRERLTRLYNDKFNSIRPASMMGAT